MISELVFERKTETSFGSGYVVQPVNASYLRKSALLQLTQDQLKAEVMGGGIVEYLLDGNDVVHSVPLDLTEVQQNFVRPEMILVPGPIWLQKCCMNLTLRRFQRRSCTSVPTLLWYVYSLGFMCFHIIPDPV